MKWLSKSRYRGTVLLSAGILLVNLFNYLISGIDTQSLTAIDRRKEIRKLDSLLAQLKQIRGEENDLATALEENPISLRPFDPNTIDHASWLEMGLPEEAFESLDRYRQKGGIFRNAAQVHKIPHLGKDLAAGLEEMVVLDTSGKKAGFPGMAGKGKNPGKFTGPFNLNQADSLQLKSVFGIGSKTADRILRYREDLGGFVREEQLYEVWGLDSLVAEELMDRCFLSNLPEIRKINPNTEEEERLVAHPYIRQGLGRLIVRYRKQHARFTKAEDLLGIRLFRTEQLERLKPYLVFD